MDYRRFSSAREAQTLSDDRMLVRLRTGEEIVESLKKLARDQKLPCAAVTGIGAVSDITLAIYSIESRRYLEARLTGELELVSLTGNVSWLGEEPVIHIHGVVSRADMTTSGGHIMRGVVSATVELMVQVYPDKVTRAMDQSVGLNLLDLA